ncbi:DUF6000 family protein [Dactylosporangium sp. NPDC050588]|uniref:DUF6000 family protein n=1 Tax=Dactylosporangium sp. NPDC050588 TaxID=3157211 RepID=UPI0033CDFE8E
MTSSTPSWSVSDGGDDSRLHRDVAPRRRWVRFRAVVRWQNSGVRRIRDDPEFAGVVDRYVRPDRRYMKLLHGNFLRQAEPERTEFIRALTDDAGQVTTREVRSVRVP